MESQWLKKHLMICYLHQQDHVCGRVHHKIQLSANATVKLTDVGVVFGMMELYGTTKYKFQV